MDTMTFRALLAQGEGDRLDYKREFPEPNKVVRCIMAIANVLRVNQRGYILIGVIERPDHTGEVVGITPDNHVDDADVHNWVANSLNRVPAFSCKIHHENGKEIGVIELVGDGKRPFYPLRDSSRDRKLLRHVPLYRQGSRINVAPPDVVIDWWREDHSTEDELARNQLAEHQARQAPLFSVRYKHHHYWDPNNNQRLRQHPPPPLVSITLQVRNIGACAAAIDSFRATWRLVDAPTTTIAASITPLSRVHTEREYPIGDVLDTSVALSLQDASQLTQGGSLPALNNIELIVHLEARSLPFNRRYADEVEPIRIPAQ